MKKDFKNCMKIDGIVYKNTIEWPQSWWKLTILSIENIPVLNMTNNLHTFSTHFQTSLKVM